MPHNGSRGSFYSDGQRVPCRVANIDPAAGTARVTVTVTRGQYRRGDRLTLPLWAVNG